MPRPKQLKRQLQELIAQKRQRDEAKRPCRECGKPLFDAAGRLAFRLIGASEQPCPACETRAAELAPNRQLYVQIPFAHEGLDEETEQRAADLAFLRACRYEYGLSDDDIRQRYEGIYDNVDELLAAPDEDGPDEAT